MRPNYDDRGPQSPVRERKAERPEQPSARSHNESYRPVDERRLRNRERYLLPKLSQHGGGTRSFGRDGRQDEDTRPNDSPNIMGGSLPKPEGVIDGWRSLRGPIPSEREERATSMPVYQIAGANLPPLT